MGRSAGQPGPWVVSRTVDELMGWDGDHGVDKLTIQ